MAIRFFGFVLLTLLGTFVVAAGVFGMAWLVTVHPGVVPFIAAAEALFLVVSMVVGAQTRRPGRRQWT